MGGEMKPRGVERAAAEAVDMIPPPHLNTLSSAISSTQRPALCRHSKPAQEGRQGQVEVNLQIGRSLQETIINKAVSDRSPLKGQQRASSLDG